MSGAKNGKTTAILQGEATRKLINDRLDLQGTGLRAKLSITEENILAKLGSIRDLEAALAEKCEALRFANEEIADRNIMIGEKVRTICQINNLCCQINNLWPLRWARALRLIPKG